MKKMRYMGCLGWRTSKLSNGDILDLGTNSKQPVKEKTPEIIC